MLGLCRFCLDFSEFGYVTEFFYVPDFQKNLEKVWDIDKCLYLCFLLYKISKKQGKNNRVPTFFYVFSEKT